MRSSFKVLWFIQNAPVYKGGVHSKCLSSFKMLWFTKEEFVQSAPIRSKCSSLQRGSSFKVLWFIQNVPVYKGGVDSKSLGSLKLLRKPRRSSHKLLQNFIQSALFHSKCSSLQRRSSFKVL
jgi:hypothetical protein